MSHKNKRCVGRQKEVQIDAHVMSTHGSIAYTRIGWDLAKIFDEMSDALKKKVSHRFTGRQRESVRTPNRLK